MARIVFPISDGGLGAGFLHVVGQLESLVVPLVCGITISTALTLLVIPLLYYGWLNHQGGAKAAPIEEVSIAKSA